MCEAKSPIVTIMVVFIDEKIPSFSKIDNDRCYRLEPTFKFFKVEIWVTIRHRFSRLG